MRQVDIKGYERYQITDDGRVWSKKSIKYLSDKKKDGNGYPQVILYSIGNPKGTPIDVHILVAKTFIPNPDNKPCIDHINGDKTDNRAENLRWVTYKENMANPLTYEKVKGINIGRHPSEEARRKMSENSSRYWLGKHLSDESKQKISEARKGKKAHNRRKIIQYTLDGKIVKEWDCIKDASDNGYTLSSIVQCCQGIRNTHRGFKWKYNSI